MTHDITLLCIKDDLSPANLILCSLLGASMAFLLVLSAGEYVHYLKKVSH